MKIEWEYETLHNGQEVWTTQFRGIDVELRRSPESAQDFQVSLTVGDTPLQQYDINGGLGTIMTDTLKQVNQYWDVMEDGPDAVYEPLDVSAMDSTDDDLT